MTAPWWFEKIWHSAVLKEYPQFSDFRGKGPLLKKLMRR